MILPTQPIPEEKPGDIIVAEKNVPIEWNIGDIILDTYEVRDIFTSGGMGNVYRVHHRGWNMDLAVKSPKQEALNDRNVPNFIRECETWVSLGLHPHIVSCYYVRNLGGIPRVFAEFVEGGSLRDWIDNGKLYEGGQTEALIRILDIAVQTAWGLQYAHEQGLIHQDVKPANILLTSDSTAKVTDFGLAKARSIIEDISAPDKRRTLIASFGGMTPAYCSPEQSAKQSLTLRSDIWNWAVSVLEMFTGGVFWLGGQFAGQALEEYHRSRPTRSELPVIPEEIFNFLRECLTIDLNKRPATVMEVADRLTTCYHTITGQRYARQYPKTVQMMADSLNNKAVSFIDLGNFEMAKSTFKEANGVEPSNPQINYNQGLLLWRMGEITDDELIWKLRDLSKARPDDQKEIFIYLGNIEIERGNKKNAENYYRRVFSRQAENVHEQRLFEAVLKQGIEWGYLQAEYKFVVDWVDPPYNNPIIIFDDGKYAISGSWDFSAVLWDLNSPRLIPIRYFYGHQNAVTCIAYSLNKQYFVTGSRDRTARLWDISTGECIKIFEGHNNSILVANLSEDGSTLLTGSANGEIRLWDVKTGNTLKRIKASEKPVFLANFYSKRELLYGIDSNEHLRGWNLITGQCRRIYDGSIIAISKGINVKDQPLMVSWCPDEPIRLWDLITTECLQSLSTTEISYKPVILSEDRRKGLSCGIQRTEYWDITSGRCIRSFELPSFSASISAGKKLYMSSFGHHLYLWKLPKGVPAPYIVSAPRSVVETYDNVESFSKLSAQITRVLETGAYSKLTKYLKLIREIPGYQNSSSLVNIVDNLGKVARKKGLLSAWLIKTLDSSSVWTDFIQISSNGRTFLSGNWKSGIQSWDLAKQECKQELQGHQYIHSISISKDGGLGASGHDDGHIELWDLNLGKIKWAQHINASIEALAFTPDNSFLISGGSDGSIKVWSIDTGKCIQAFGESKYSLYSISVSPFGQHIITACSDHRIYLWRIVDGTLVKVLKDFPPPDINIKPLNSEKIFSVYFSPNGKSCISGNGDSTLRLWDISSGKCVRTFVGHSDSVKKVVISKNGQMAFSASLDHTVRMWDVNTGLCVRVFGEQTAGFISNIYQPRAIRSFDISPDGAYLIIGQSNNTLCWWKLDWDLAFQDQQDWDESARAILESFLASIPIRRKSIFRNKIVTWSDSDFKNLMVELSYAGYGWLRPEGVQHQLEKMAREWEGLNHYLGDDI